MFRKKLNILEEKILEGMNSKEINIFFMSYFPYINLQVWEVNYVKIIRIQLDINWDVVTH